MIHVTSKHQIPRENFCPKCISWRVINLKSLPFFRQKYFVEGKIFSSQRLGQIFLKMFVEDTLIHISVKNN